MLYSPIASKGSPTWEWPGKLDTRSGKNMPIELQPASTWDMNTAPGTTSQWQAGEQMRMEPRNSRAEAYGALLETGRKLSAFAALDHDWDSYGAVPPTASAIEMAQSFLEMLTGHHASHLGCHLAPDIVTPIPGGGIQMDWWGNRVEVELDVNAEGRIGYLLIQKTGNEDSYTENNDVSLPDAVDMLARSIVM